MQTFKLHPNNEEATAIFQSRLLALANAHDVLTGENWSGADLLDVVDRILEPFRLANSRITVEGPKVRLTPRQALAIGMAVHELATNASKYGALASAEGRISLFWRMLPTGNHVEVIWTEVGGPIVSPPTQHGFGSRLNRTASGAGTWRRRDCEVRTHGRGGRNSGVVI